MLIEIVDATLQTLHEKQFSLGVDIFAVAVIVCSIWLTWHLWRFFIVRLLWPDEPYLLPYRIPVIGMMFLLSRR